MRRALLILLCALLLGGCGQTKDTTQVVLTPRESPAAAEVTHELTEPPTHSLAGDWYGWWRIFHTSGDWEEMYGYFWDCCAVIGEDGSLLLWDEVFSKDNCLAETTLIIEGGALRCVGGSMLDAPLAPESWEVTLTEDEGGRLLTLSGRYDAVVHEGGFAFEIFLRPWGSLWPGRENELPYYYEDWYLPLIRAGSAMPDTVGP